MKIQTTRFGEIDGDADLIFNFVMPILGYSEEDEFILIEANKTSAFKWLQSTKNPDLAFPVTSPGFFGIEYTFELPDEAENILEIKSAEDLLVLNMAKIPSENPRKSTVNLLAPIVFNLKNQKAGQVILTKTGFNVEQPLFEDDKTKVNKKEQVKETQA